jgi:hypothetical protein
MPSASTVLIIAGVIAVTSVRAWAYRASPRGNPDPQAGAIFRQRMLIYYGALALFVIAWIVQNRFLQPRP